MNRDVRFIRSVRKNFTAQEWDWITKDENCVNVIAKANYFEVLFYCRFRVPRRLRSGFWAD